jgi:hypothetical protein
MDQTARNESKYMTAGGDRSREIEAGVVLQQERLVEDDQEEEGRR